MKNEKNGYIIIGISVFVTIVLLLCLALGLWFGLSNDEEKEIIDPSIKPNPEPINFVKNDEIIQLYGSSDPSKMHPFLTYYPEFITGELYDLPNSEILGNYQNVEKWNDTGDTSMKTVSHLATDYILNFFDLSPSRFTEVISEETEMIRWKTIPHNDFSDLNFIYLYMHNTIMTFKTETLKKIYIDEIQIDRTIIQKILDYSNLNTDMEEMYLNFKDVVVVNYNLLSNVIIKGIDYFSIITETKTEKDYIPHIYNLSLFINDYRTYELEVHDSGDDIVYELDYLIIYNFSFNLTNNEDCNENTGWHTFNHIEFTTTYSNYHDEDWDFSSPIIYYDDVINLQPLSFCLF